MNFEKYAPEANSFVKEIAMELGPNQDTDQAYRVMKAVFRTLREILTPEESAHLIAQLPLMLKAVYIDGWNFQAKNRIRSMDAFLACLRSKDEMAAPRDFGNDETAKTHVKIVLGVLQRHVSAGEIMDVLNQFPGELSELWLAPAKNV
ncbi:DUF2267 domain-containing protein [Chitinophaga japonensis]|uniref:Uncharacterized protein (DUF2267 family) n=1 Tax=Chitinophaga japonensis TaxID=104662 RepID=A0A562TGE8_CHIJA|nr:DUF2267 domain-containing protein [Chitinophaga japonensis]TWI92314.1 uncharacterized protein (DUF2267 family) [Chitinophaga japonensis]